VTIVVQVLMSPGCGHGQKTVELVRDVLREARPGARLETVLVSTTTEAQRLAFLGSPTVRVNGVDIDLAPPGGVDWVDGCTGSRACPRVRW
jgi:hypothetical protein